MEVEVEIILTLLKHQLAVEAEMEDPEGRLCTSHSDHYLLKFFDIHSKKNDCSNSSLINKVIILQNIFHKILEVNKVLSVIFIESAQD